MLRPVCGLAALLLTTTAFAQPLIYDSFDGAALHERWTVDSARGNSATVDPARQVLILEGMENQFNHLETPLPEGRNSRSTGWMSGGLGRCVPLSETSP